MDLDEVWVCGWPITMKNEDLRIEIPCNVCEQLWYLWTICPFTKCDLLLIAFFCYNTIGKIRGLVNIMGESIPWVGVTYNTIGKLLEWINFIGGWIPRFDSIKNTMGEWIPWVDEHHVSILLRIPWVNSIGGWMPWMDKFHGWINSMSGWIFHLDPSSLLKKQWSPFCEVPSWGAFVEYEVPLKRMVLCG